MGKSNKKRAKKSSKKQSNTLTFSVTFVAWLFFFVLGIFFVYKVGNMLYKQHLSFSVNNTVPITVLSSEVKESYPLNKFGEKNIHNPSYSPVIHYSYNLEGKLYKSKQILPDVDTTDMRREIVEKLINTFPVGKTSTAYCSTQNPQKAFLVKIVDPYPYMFWLGLLLPMHLVVLFLFPVLAIRWPNCNEFSVTLSSRLIRFFITLLWYISGIVVEVHECYLAQYSVYSDFQGAVTRISILSIVALVVFIPWLRFILVQAKQK
ncbi:DUF3592 domain-containing protein [Candidatus Uabimicrobium sp. HlEnr_7]|uniref:DUF3592 domain-containing protein n=1 Tax=Candidatus Uabimicrobium helgolandensis TaxID=3095367 RepID=UPI003556581A